MAIALVHIAVSLQSISAIARYNEVMKAFYTSQQMNVPGDWSEHSSKRVATPESLSGRVSEAAR